MDAGSHTVSKFGASYRPITYDFDYGIARQGLWAFAGGLVPLILAVPAADRAALTGPLAPPPTTVLTALQTFNFNLPAQWIQGFGDTTFSAQAGQSGTLRAGFVEGRAKLHARLRSSLPV